MTDKEVEQTLETLSGGILLRCVNCGEAIPWLDREHPRWTYIHEAEADYPDCINKWPNGKYVSSKWDELWTRVRDGRAYWIRPTEEQLERAKAVKI